MATADERRFLRDIDLPQTAGEAYQTTTTGDLRDVTGFDNLAKAQRRRAITTQGAMAHRPLYGGSLGDEVEEAGTPAGRAEAANRIRRNGLRDPRVEDVLVRVTVGTPADPLDGSALTVQLSVKARGADEADAGTFEIEV